MTHPERHSCLVAGDYVDTLNATKNIQSIRDFLVPVGTQLWTMREMHFVAWFLASQGIQEMASGGSGFIGMM